MQVSACRMEVRLTVVAVCVAAVATIFFLWDLSFVVTATVRSGHFLHAGIAAIFAGIVVAFLYGNLAYFLSRIGSTLRHADSCS